MYTIKIDNKEYKLAFNIGVLRQFGRNQNIKSFSKTAQVIGKAFETLDEFDSADKVADFVAIAINKASASAKVTPEKIVDHLYNEEVIKVIVEAFAEAFGGGEEEKKPTRAQRRAKK